ncbi:MAG: hypothetical protein JSV86_17640 [Gemmatimonadota bacterium]|nr:MAG: hypothetical protein JSV86_17640 [Gemmatimonadota bacterium]
MRVTRGRQAKTQADPPELQLEAHRIIETAEALEAGGNLLIFVGLLLVFLVTLEGWIKQRRALHALRDLRALAHIVDMQQLTKDPGKVLPLPRLLLRVALFGEQSRRPPRPELRRPGRAGGRSRHLGTRCGSRPRTSSATIPATYRFSEG